MLGERQLIRNVRGVGTAPTLAVGVSVGVSVDTRAGVSVRSLDVLGFRTPGFWAVPKGDSPWLHASVAKSSPPLKQASFATGV